MEDAPLPSTDTRTSYTSSRRDYGAVNSGGMGGYERSGYERRDNYPSREQLPFPDKPPYTAHLANLSFDVTDGDIRDFFRDCEVTSVRIVEDKVDRKPKGFGYVEFGSADGLRNALSLSGRDLVGRSVRLSVAEPSRDRPEASRDFSDWSRKGPLPDLPQNNRRVSERAGFGRSFNDNASDAGSERGTRRGYGNEPDGKVRDFSNWERRGPLSPAAVSPRPDMSLGAAGRQMSKEGFRRNSPSWGEGGRSQEGSRPPPRRDNTTERLPMVDRPPTAAELDNKWRDNMRPDGPPPPKSPEPAQISTPSSPAPPPPPTSRPRLQLQKRTVSEAVGEPSSAADSKASPFGAAKPIDTAAREREVVEKREMAIREKREAEEKARAEAQRPAKDKEDVVEAPSSTETEGTEPNGGDKVAPPKYEVLRRQASGTNDMVAEKEEEEDGEADEEKVRPETDTAVKPREVVRDGPSKPQNGTWRQKSSRRPEKKPAEGEESETAQLEEDGWSTVSKPQKKQNNRRNNQQPARALAS